jgi:molybdopterin/thiamine biosynthesis adenylyltransferase
MFEFIPNTVPNTVVVVGAGGTGGRLIPLLAQFLKTMPWVIDPAIIIVDDDIVEEKNLLRQNFIRADVGRPKAVVMAERYSRAFNIEIIPVVKRVEGYYREHKVLFENRTTDNGSPIVVMCVDSADARRAILKAFYSVSGSGQPLFIDAGNEDSFGQVMAFHAQYLTRSEGYSFQDYLNQYEIPPMLPVRVRVPSLYIDLDFYANLVDTPGGSCADLDQTLAINAMMATSIMGVIQNYYYVKPFTTTRINLVVAQGGSSNMSDLRGMYNIASTTPIRELVESSNLRGTSLDSLFSEARRSYDLLMEEQREAARVLKEAEEARAKAEKILAEAMAKERAEAEALAMAEDATVVVETPEMQSMRVRIEEYHQDQLSEMNAIAVNAINASRGESTAATVLTEEMDAEMYRDAIAAAMGTGRTTTVNVTDGEIDGIPNSTVMLDVSEAGLEVLISALSAQS